MKAIIFASLLVCLLAVSPLDKLNAVARQDTCAANVLDLIKPEIDAKLEELKNVHLQSSQNQNLNMLVDTLALMEKGKKMLDACEANKPAVKVGDVVEWDGVALLLASNCFKDAGIELLLADTVIQDPKDYTNDIVVAIFGYILGIQAVKDCAQFEHFII